jgi:amino acid transporter
LHAQTLPQRPAFLNLATIVCPLSLRSDIPDWREDGTKGILVDGVTGKLAAFWLCCCQACFAYQGAEIIGITAIEVERPRETLPKAVRRVSIRLVFYYVATLFILGLNLSSDDPVLAWHIGDPNGSYLGPFVLVAQRANIGFLPDLLNAITLTAAITVANANLYLTVILFSQS